jgi:bifunctional DNA-binding transcriptional regulator/antitoxin component of YhaV-PrlF toxin-antitoxin module
VSEDGDVWIPNSVTKEDKVVKWQLPIEVDGISGEYYIQFPDDLMEAASIKEDDFVEWIDRKDGSFELRKVKNAE